MRFSHVPLFIAIAVCPIFLGGCGSFRQWAPPGATGTAPSPAARVSSSSDTHGISWIAKRLTGQDLLYVSNANGTVSVYGYSNGTVVGVLTKFAQPQGMCADRSGNVYIADFKARKVDEYAHGDTKPIFALNERPYHPYACSVDPKTGDVAVADFSQSYDTPEASESIRPDQKKPKRTPLRATTTSLAVLTTIAGICSRSAIITTMVTPLGTSSTSTTCLKARRN